MFSISQSLQPLYASLVSYRYKDLYDHNLVYEYFKENYFSDELLIVASGNIDNDELTHLTRKFLKKSYSNSDKHLRKKPRPQKPKSKIIKHPVNQFYSIIGSASVGYSNPDYYTLRLLSIILGEGSSSRLFQSLREKSGIAYQINTFVNSYSDVSAFGTYFSTNKSNRAKARKIIIDEYDKFLEKGVIQYMRMCSNQWKKMQTLSLQQSFLKNKMRFL